MEDVLIHTKTIDDLGRIGIPKIFRQELNISAGDLIDITVHGDIIILKKHMEE